jgi:predicted RNA-binding protein with TRAM domain
VKAIIIALLVTFAACKFDQKDFGDRTCTIDQDCGRPDLGCIEGTCAPRTCTVAADCGPAFAFACTDLGCVAQGCSAADDCGIGYACNADGLCQASFNVASAHSTSNTSVDVMFDGPPDPVAAVDPASYAISGLSILGTPSLSGSTVTLTTSPQTPTTYTVTVTNVTRAGDHVALGAATAAFDGRAAFDVTGAMSTSGQRVVVTFDAEPEATSGATLANYSIPGLTLGGTPVIAGNTVTLTTTQQAAQPYTVTVSGVRRAADGEALTQTSAMFGGRNAFDVAAAAPHTSSAVDVTFDAAPNAAQATTLANYSIPGLTLSGVPVLTGNTVRITTSSQAAVPYTVTVSGVTRASDGEPLTVVAAGFTGISAFDVASATAITSHAVRVTFDGPPDPMLAVDPTSYDIQGLTIGGTPVLSGNSVTLQTSPQTAGSYTVSVSNVTRTDGEPLTVTSAQFTGRPPFDVDGALSATSTRVIVSFDAPPNAGQAANLANYAIQGLTLSGTPQVSGNSVTLTTSPQSATDYAVTVANVTRAGDGEPMTVTTASFTGRAPFDVTGAVATASGRVVVTFDAAPNAAEATTLANYTIPGLTLTGAPILAGNQVTLATTVQAIGTYAVVVSGVTRASDGEALTVASASFAGRPPFDVASAASTSNQSMTVTFDAAPDPAEATDPLRYSVDNGLAIVGTPVLSGNTVTLQTTPQNLSTYVVTVAGVHRASDGEALTNTSASFSGRTGFNVASADSVNATTMSVSFDAPPNPAQATTLANYSVPGLALSGTPVLAGNTVTITTAVQAAQTYTVTVAGVTRQSDGSPLAVNSASFTHVAFNVASAASVTSHSIGVTFDAPPNPAQATTLANYSVLGLTLSGTPVLSGNTVTISTSSQAGTNYTVNVANVTRASDGTILSNRSASFTGRAPFDVSSATSTSSGSITVTFSAPPNAAAATSLASYSVPGLTLSGTPLLSGNTVTLTTSAQANQSYTVTVSNVTRASDGEALGTRTATFGGTALQPPTVTNVVVVSSSPDNGTRYYNTGSATVVITGTDFTGVSCPSGVRLDDTNGSGAVIGTRPTSCTVDSGTQITATFPPGILTNGTLGWDVQVTNAAGTNAASAVNFVPYAGLLVSEVMQGRQGAAQRELVELYNPTQHAITVTPMHLHIRTGPTTDRDTPLTFLHTTIPSHGFFLIASTQSSQEPWYASVDATYDASAGELTSNGGMYLSLSATSEAKVIDKLGWGNVPAPWYEGKSTNNLGNDSSVQRKPAGGAGAATDTDNNKNDFNAPSSAITPLGSSAPPQP